jgi:hypothetical protein
MSNTPRILLNIGVSERCLCGFDDCLHYVLTIEINDLVGRKRAVAKLFYDAIQGEHL